MLSSRLSALRLRFPHFGRQYPNLCTRPSSLSLKLLSTSCRRQTDDHFNLTGPKAEGDSTKTTTSQALPGKVEPRLSLTFTCTVSECGERSTHEFSKRAYTSGIVVVQCPKCKNRHLIADHLGWFKESTKDGKLPTIEDLVKERVKKGKLNFGGDVEYFE